jgi:hypothetical protein
MGIMGLTAFIALKYAFNVKQYILFSSLKQPGIFLTYDKTY